MHQFISSKFQFGNVVVVEENEIGVIVKTFFSFKTGVYSHDIYVRSYNGIKCYPEHEIKHFIYSKQLAEDELEFYRGV